MLKLVISLLALGLATAEAATEWRVKSFQGSQLRNTVSESVRVGTKCDPGVVWKSSTGKIEYRSVAVTRNGMTIYLPVECEPVTVPGPAPEPEPTPTPEPAPEPTPEPTPSPTPTPTPAPSPQPAGALYVAPGGSDSAACTQSAPCATIGGGIRKLASGGTLVVKRGTYIGSANFLRGIPSGSAGRHTTVMAESPMDVRIVSNGGATEQLLIAGNYIKVDGFIFDMQNNAGTSHIGTIETGSFNKITRCIFKRSGPITQWGGLLALGGSNNLVEDVAGVGACRYCFEQGGPDSTTQRNIWRRVIARFDYGASQLPKATFATYGNNQTNPPGGQPLVRDHLYQNIVIIDGNNPQTGGEAKYGGMYTAKTASNIRVIGSVVINEDAGLWGLFNREWKVSGAASSNNTVSHTLMWKVKAGGGLKADRADHITMDAGSLDLTGGITDSRTSGRPADLLNSTPGAVILKRYGVSGTVWGEPGYDQLTSDDLWPWPYEAKIKAVFAESNPTPSGYTPTNNPTRGWAGSAMSLKDYINAQ